LELADEYDKAVRVSYSHYHRSGLNLDKLDAVQKAAYEELGRIIDDHQYVPVTGLRMTAKPNPMIVGSTFALDCEITPTDATRQNVIWQSNDPAVASVDKLGVISANAVGTTKVTVYSWDDARPLANNQPETFSKTGIQASVKIQVKGSDLQGVDSRDLAQ
jgi:uncharacterized protein YjdB